jgi:endonuclease/exonuclease/phosphatase (EEP) superfamily protein YafD
MTLREAAAGAPGIPGIPGNPVASGTPVGGGDYGTPIDPGAPGTPGHPPPATSGGARSSDWRRIAGRILVVLGWVVVGALALVAFMRIVAWDRFRVFALLDAATLFVYLPAWPVTVVAFVRRRWLLGALGLAVVVAQILFVLPELTAAQPLPADARGAPTLRLFDANVYADNPDMSGYAEQIIADHPDLVTLEEASPYDEQQLQFDGALDNLPYRTGVAIFGPQGFVIASRYPLGPRSVAKVDGYPYLVRTTVELPSGPVPLWVVHTSAPVSSDFGLWRAELDGVAHLLAQVRPHHVLVVGDFNATWGNQGFHAVLDTGLTDGAAARGDALSMTWSQKMIVPPLLRIDHVLTGTGLAVTTIATHPGPGSDHRDLTATMAVLPAARSSGN